jgi:glycosyltransferase involved in cell wall biosynthesis
MIKKRKILIVGQTPPPYGGQAVMIEQILLKKYEALTLFHVRLNFSKEMDEIGKFRIGKIFHLLEVIVKILIMRVRHNVRVLYYPPPGPNRIPVYRDLIILSLVRPWFNKVIFHFHASGLSELYPQVNPLLKFFFRLAYYAADGGIKLSQLSADDPAALRIKKQFLIPYGIPDESQTMKRSTDAGVVRILFVGVNSEQKGVLILVNAAAILKNKGLQFSISFVGKFESEIFQKKIEAFVRENNLSSHITFHGVKVGKEKFQHYVDSDIFCFPSFFDAESFPVVLLEACSFGLPIVSTRWRGIPSIVREDDNGFVVSIKSASEIAEKLEFLIKNTDKRTLMGVRSRQIYQEEYTIERFFKSIESALLTV